MPKIFLSTVLLYFCSLNVVNAIPLSESFKQHIYSSELGVYHSNLTNEESEELLLKQLLVANECTLSQGYCEHALYSLLISAKIKLMETDTVAAQQEFMYLQDAYSQLEQGQEEALAALYVPLNFTNVRISHIQQLLLEELLVINAQATPIEFRGTYATLLKEIEEGKLERLNVSTLNEIIDLDNKLTVAYLQLLQSILRKYAESNFLNSQMNELVSSAIGDIINKKGRSIRCEHCTTNFIIEYYNDHSLDKSYGETSVADFVARRTLAKEGFDNYRIAFPHYYVSEIVPFIIGLKTYIHENAPRFIRNGRSLNNLSNEEKLLVFREIRDAIQREGVSLNFANIVNMTFKWLTATGQMESLLSSGVKLASLRSGQFDPGSHNKIFAANIFANVVLKKIPRILEGEVLRYGCSSSQWQLPPVLYMLLEDKCVFTPSFEESSFSITASTTFGTQDEHGYEISIYHKPANTILFSKIISKKQEITLYRDALGAFSADDLVLYIRSTNPSLRNDIAIIQLSERLFETGFGGVIKNNVFYFVRKLQTPEFNRFRGDDYGCSLVSTTIEHQINCLKDKLHTHRLPNYFYKNMESIGPAFLGLHTTLESVIEAEDNKRKEAERRALEKLMADKLKGRGWVTSSRGF